MACSRTASRSARSALARAPASRTMARYSCDRSRASRTMSQSDDQAAGAGTGRRARARRSRAKASDTGSSSDLGVVVVAVVGEHERRRRQPDDRRARPRVAPSMVASWVVMRVAAQRRVARARWSWRAGAAWGGRRAPSGAASCWRCGRPRAVQRASMVFRDAVRARPRAQSSRGRPAAVAERGQEVGERGVAPGVAPEVGPDAVRGTPPGRWSPRAA